MERYFRPQARQGTSLGPFGGIFFFRYPFPVCTLGLSKILSSSSHSTSLRNSYVPAAFVFGCFRYVPTVRVTYHTRTNSPRESSDRWTPA